jgi:cardiolipin synthase A/B
MSIPSWATSAPTAVAVVLVALGLALRLAALGVIPANRKPSTGMAWLLVILLSPIIGFVAFLFFGSARLERRRRAWQGEASRRIMERTRGIADLPPDPDVPAYARSVAELNCNLGALPMLAGNQVELVDDYGDSIKRMTDAVRSAESFVHVEFYITAWDEVTGPLFEELTAAAERGVAVRLLFDHLGSRRIAGYADMTARLAKTKIDWHPMLPVQPLKGKFRRPDLRNHRKLMVVDGRVGFTGSQNLTEPGYNKPKNHKLGREWVELMVRLHGPVVAALQAVFATDWYAETEEILTVEQTTALPEPTTAAITGVAAQVVPSGPGFVTENNLRMFTTLIYGATRRLSLTSPYFVPDESLLYAVTTAAQRGVDVELFVSELSDQFMVGHAQASYYRALLDAGVRIYLFPAPYILHSKFFTVDDDVAVIGSSNMDMRSFALNFEVSLMMLGADAVAGLRRIQDDYRGRSRPLTVTDWSKRPARLRYVDNVMRLTAALQ